MSSSLSVFSKGTFPEVSPYLPRRQSCSERCTNAATSPRPALETMLGPDIGNIGLDF